MTPEETTCSQMEREQVVRQLRDYFGEGHLLPSELDARLDRALEARTCGELRQALAHLPVMTRPRPALRVSVTRVEAVTLIAAVLAVLLWATGHLGEDAAMITVAIAVALGVWRRRAPRRD